MLDEFIAQEIAAHRIDASLFTRESKTIHLHGHCFQKSLASVHPTVAMLSLPENYTVNVIPSGCCGMAGSFGYEAEHYEVSMKVGELVLFPSIRKLAGEVLIAAPGTSCRHQIHDGTNRTALHPAQILRNAGFWVETAADGWEAWEKLQLRSYDLLLTDLEMSRLHGYELIAKCSEAAGQALQAR